MLAYLYLHLDACLPISISSLYLYLYACLHISISICAPPYIYFYSYISLYISICLPPLSLSQWLAMAGLRPSVAKRASRSAAEERRPPHRYYAATTPPGHHRWQMAGVRIAFSGSFPRNTVSLPMSALFLTRVDCHSYSLLSRRAAPGTLG